MPNPPGATRPRPRPSATTEDSSSLNRARLQRLADERALDAGSLLAAGRWSGAYYLAGYAVECALKACIARRVNQHDFPDKKLAQDCCTHHVEKLVDVAGLKSLRDADTATRPILALHWIRVKDWNEEARYDIRDEKRARELFGAVIDVRDGALPWIKGHW